MKAKEPLKAKTKYVYKPKKRNKSTKSILQETAYTYCFLCGSQNKGGLDSLEEHHVFFGNGLRILSEKYGLKVYLCGATCHRLGKKAVHQCDETNRMLKRYAQQEFEKRYGHELFMKEFGRNSIEIEEKAM